MTFAAFWEALVAFLKAIPIFAKYFPPKTAAEKEKEARDDVAKEEQAAKDGERPKW